MLDNRMVRWIRARQISNQQSIIMKDKNKTINNPQLTEEQKRRHELREESERNAYNRDLFLRAMNGRVGSGMTYRP